MNTKIPSFAKASVGKAKYQVLNFLVSKKRASFLCLALLIFSVSFFILSPPISNAKSSYWKTYFSETERKAVEKNAEKYTQKEIKEKSQGWKNLFSSFHIKNGSIEDQDISSDGIAMSKIKGLENALAGKLSATGTLSGVLTWAAEQTFPADKLTGTYAALDGSQITGITASQVGAATQAWVTNLVSNFLETDAEGNLDLESGDLTAGDITATGSVSIGTTGTPSKMVVNGPMAWNKKPVIVLFGDSLTHINDSSDEAAGIGDRGFFNWANAMMGQKFTVYDEGIDGNTTNQMLARLGDVTEHTPQYCFVMAGVNDISAGTSATTIYSNLVSIYEQLRQSGIQVIISTITPDSRNTTATRNETYSYVNRKLREYASTNGIILIDMAAMVIDPTSSNNVPASGMTDDEVHYSSKGALVLGKTAYNALSGLFPSVPNLPITNADSYNLINNGLQIGSGGTAGANVSGNISASWGINASNGTVTASKVARTDGLPGEWQQIEISTTGDGGARFYQSKTGLSAIAGEDVYGFIEVSIPAWTNQRLLNVLVDYKDSSNTILATSKAFYHNGGANLGETPLDVVMTLRFPKVTVPANVDRVTVWVYFDSSTGGTGTIKVGRTALYVDQ